jgi:hypothetical protein
MGVLCYSLLPHEPVLGCVATILDFLDDVDSMRISDPHPHGDSDEDKHCSGVVDTAEGQLARWEVQQIFAGH